MKKNKLLALLLLSVFLVACSESQYVYVEANESVRLPIQGTQLDEIELEFRAFATLVDLKYWSNDYVKGGPLDKHRVYDFRTEDSLYPGISISYMVGQYFGGGSFIVDFYAQGFDSQDSYLHVVSLFRNEFFVSKNIPWTANFAEQMLALDWEEYERYKSDSEARESLVKLRDMIDRDIGGARQSHKNGLYSKSDFDR